MKGIVVDETSSAKSLLWREVDEPSVGADDVGIRVHAAGINRADLLQRIGKYPPPHGTSTIMGLEVAGEIESVGSRVSHFKPGMRVCALLAGGGYAEKVAVHAGSVIPLPPKATYVEGAAIPEAFITAYANLFYEGDLRSGESVLVHGGSSGVGTAAIQLARVVGARVAVTVGNAEKAARCSALGADRAVVYKADDFSRAIREWAGEFGVDLILDCVGGEYLQRNVALLATSGRLVVIGTMGGSSGTLDLIQLMRKRARIIGSVLRSRSNLEKSELVRGFVEKFWSYVEFRNVYPVVDSVFPIQEAEAAHEHMRTSEHIGKIVLEIS